MNIPISTVPVPIPQPMIYPVGCIVKSCIPVVAKGSSEPYDEDTLQHLIELAMIL